MEASSTLIKVEDTAMGLKLAELQQLLDQRNEQHILDFENNRFTLQRAIFAEDMNTR